MPAAATPVDPRVFLAQHAPFDALSPAAFDAIEAALEIRYAASGERLLARGGATADALWIVRKGRIHLERDGEVLEVVGPGECFGYPSMVSATAPQRDAVAAEDCLLFRVPRPVFERLLDEPGAARFFLEGLTERLRATIADSPTGARELVVPLREIASRRLVTIARGATAAEAAARMKALGLGSLLVAAETAEVGELPRHAVYGIVTDRDLRDRVLAAGRSPSTPVADILSAPLAVLELGATSLDALLAMSSQSLRHLPLVEGDRLVGLVSASDLARLQSRQPLSLLRRIRRQPLLELLPHYARDARRAVAELSRAGVEATHLGSLVATLNDTLAERLVAAATGELGAPPVSFAWMVHGSDGRREQLLPTDQDNAIAWREAAGGVNEGAAAWIERLAGFMVDGLLAAGFPRCPGGYMATGWHDPIGQWEQRLAGWIAVPRAEIVIDLCTLLDLRHVAGELDLAPLSELRREAGRSRHLLRRLAEELVNWSLPIGLFGGLKEGGSGFDLKRGSLLIVGVARLFALEAGGAAQSTLDRLVEAEPVLGADAATLAEAFRYLAGLRLEHGLAADGDVVPSGHRLRLAELNTMERRFLKDIFGFLQQLIASLPQRFAL